MTAPQGTNSWLGRPPSSAEEVVLVHPARCSSTSPRALATPILHHPQVAILGVHEVKKKPAVVNDQIVARDLGNLSLSLDHRVVDGAVGADFLYALIDRPSRRRVDRLEAGERDVAELGIED